jgi:hypothetical protein
MGGQFEPVRQAVHFAMLPYFDGVRWLNSREVLGSQDRHAAAASAQFPRPPLCAAREAEPFKRRGAQELIPRQWASRSSISRRVMGLSSCERKLTAPNSVPG